MRVGLISMEVAPGQPGPNLRRAKRLSGEAAAASPDVICLPEMVAVSDGYPHGRFREMSEPIPGRYSAHFAALARAYGLYIVVGLMERTDAGFYSSAILLDPPGEILLKHRQVHNAGPFLAGDSFDFVDTPLGRMAIAICGDVWEERLLDAVEQSRPDYIFLPMDWCGEDDELGLITDQAPPRYLGEWKEHFREVSARSGGTLFAANAVSNDTDTGPGSCGGAFVFSQGREIIPDSIAPGCWRQPLGRPICLL